VRASQRRAAAMVLATVTSVGGLAACGDDSGSTDSGGSKNLRVGVIYLDTQGFYGGVKKGITYGATDAIGLRAVEKPVHFRDLHATIINQLGLNQDALSYMHQGRKERLTG